MSLRHSFRIVRKKIRSAAIPDTEVEALDHRNAVFERRNDQVAVGALTLEELYTLRPHGLLSKDPESR